MTLIFSNENRILFNIESPDQLVKLAYGNRFNLLADSGNTKAHKKFSEEKSISYKAYRERWAPCPSPNTFKNRRSVCDGVEQVAFRSSNQKPFFFIKKDKKSGSNLFPNRSLPPIFSRDHKAKVVPHQKVNGKPVTNSPICTTPSGKSVGQILQIGEFVPATKKPFRKHLKSLKQSFSKSKPSTDSPLENRWKASIKIFVPKIKLWSFAFGTSFLVVVMTSIVQKQDQNRWFFILSKNQLPGLHVETNGTSQESSWEGFENITLKYVDRNRKALFSKLPNSKNLVKSIEPYKEIWYLYFSELWKQQSLQNYTAVFSGRSTTSFSDIISNSEATGWRNHTSLQISDLSAKSETSGKRFGGKYKSSLNTEGDPFGATKSEPHQERKRWLCQPWYTLLARESFTNRSTNWSTNRRFVLATKSKIKQYKDRVTIENDSIPLKMSSSLQIENLSGQVLQIGDLESQPSNTFTNRRFVCDQKRSNKNFIFSPNDIVKTLFYKFGNFSIDSKSFLGGKATGLTDSLHKSTICVETESKPLRPLREISGEQKSSQLLGYEVDVFDDFSLSCNKDAFDRDRLSFLQQENFFKTPDYFKPELFKTNYIYPFSQVKKDSLQSLVMEPFVRTNLRHTSKVAPSQIVDLCGTGDPQKEGLGQVTNQSSSLQIEARKHFENKTFEANFQNEEEFYHSSPQRVSKNFKVLFFKTKRLHLYTASKKGKRCRAKLDAPSQIKDFDNQSFLFSEPTLFQTLDQKGSQFPEKIANCFLSKQNRISNRFMSGYQFPEIKSFQVEPKPPIFGRGKDVANPGPTSHSIKIPPALPFYESKLKKANLLNKTYFRSDHIPYNWKANLLSGERSFCSVASQSAYTNLGFVKGKTKLTPIAKQSFARPHTNLRFVKGKPVTNSPICTTPSTPRIQIGSLKKIPYRKLSLNELEEITPLFDEVNKTFRISPYQFRFKRLLFTDYNDYLSWQKDTSAAISIAPSLEEDKPIKDSWFFPHSTQKMTPFHSGNEDLEKEKNGAFLKGDSETKRALILSKSSTEGDGAGGFAIKQENSDGGTIKKEKQKEDSVWSSEDRSTAKLENSQERFSDSSAVGEEDDKKKGLTKFEWLEQIREGDRLVEKRKDFQKEAYSNRQALYVEHLQSKPGKVQRFFVTGRKESFFGIANLFPKRLVAQDQKQIKHQILRDAEDQKVVSLLFGGKQDPYLKTDNFDTLPCFGLDSSNNILVEDLFKSGVLPSTSHTNLRFVKSSTEATQNKVLHGTQKREDANQSSTLNLLGRQELFSSLRTVPRNQVLYKSKSSIASREGGEAGVTNRGPSSNTYGDGVGSPSVQALPPKSVSANKICKNLKKNSVVLKVPLEESFVSKQDFKKFQNLFSGRQHPIYTPNRRLRLRMPQSSLSLQNNNPQSRLDDLNLSQSHRWWQKRRLESSLLGTPSKRYLVMPEIHPQDWKKIIEWQLKIFFLEEEKRIEPLFLEKTVLQNGGGFQSNKDLCFSGGSGVTNQKFVHASKISPASPLDLTEATQNKASHPSSVLESLALQGIQDRSNSFFKGETNLQPKDLFKIKKIAIYLPWTTLKKSLKKPFEWPITGLSYHSSLQDDSVQNYRDLEPARTNLGDRFQALYKSKIRTGKWLGHQDLYDVNQSFRSVKNAVLNSGEQSFRQNQKARSCFVASIAPNFKSFGLSTFNFLPGDTLESNTFGDTFGKMHVKGSFVRGKFCYQTGQKKIKFSQKQLHQTSVYKPFLFEETPKNLYLLLHSLALAVVFKQFLVGLSKGFGKLITQKIKNSSLGLALLPIFFNARSRKNQIPEFSHLKKRLNDLLSSEETISSLSELVWYLRNSCRGRMIPRGVVLLETFSSETTAFLKAIGGEAQVPVIVQSLRGLPFTQSHPQRHFEKILQFAQKRSPCILFLDDLDSIGQSRTLLLKNNVQPSSFWDQNPLKKDSEIGLETKVYNFTGGNKETFEKRKWKKPNTGVCASPLRHLRCFQRGTKFFQSVNTFTNQRFVCDRSRQALHLPVPDSQSVTGKSKLFASSSPFSKENKTLHLSETEKIVEQRRVDLMLRLLTVMDGISYLKGVLIVTTSKNPALLDPALLRPGRFEKLINLKLPNKKKRIELLKLEIQKIGYTNPMPWGYFGTETQDMTGTEISSAINHSAFRAILQSTVHTFSTLEYGIRCAKGESFSIGYPEKQKTIHTSTPFLSEGVSTSFRSKTKRDRHILYRQVLQIGDLYLQSKKVEPLSSEIAFYHAGKGVIQGLILHDTISSSCSISHRRVNYAQNFASQRKSCCTCNSKPKRVLSRIFLKRSKIKTSHSSFTKLNFVQNVVQLYAGKASLSLYLDSISNFRNKGLERSVQQPLFLESNLSYKEGLHASLILENYLTFFNAYKKQKRGVKSLPTVSSPSVFREKNKNKFVHITKICKFLSKKNFRFLNSQNFSKKSCILDSNNFLQHNQRKYFDFVLSNEPNDSVLIYDKIDNDLWWGEKTSEMVKTVKRSLGNWYRLYLPKLEQDKNNREWLLPDQFFDQHRSLSWLQRYLSDRFPGKDAKQSFASPNKFNTNYKAYTEGDPTPKGEGKTDYKSFDLHDRFVKGNQWRAKNGVSNQTQCTNGEEHRLLCRRFVTVFPKRNKSKFVIGNQVCCNTLFCKRAQFFQEKQNRMSQTSFLKKLALKNQKFQFLHKENSTDFSFGYFATCLSDSLEGALQETGGGQSYRFKKPISYYSIVLTCFYSAFQNCAENRELLDFLSDHLIRFKILRLHEIMRILSFYL